MYVIYVSLLILSVECLIRGMLHTVIVFLGDAKSF